MKRTLIPTLILLAALASVIGLWFGKSRNAPIDQEALVAPPKQDDRQTEDSANKPIPSNPSRTLVTGNLDLGKCSDEWEDFYEGDSIGQAINILANSDSPEHLLAAALIPRENDEAYPDLELLYRAYLANPQSPLAVWEFVLACDGNDSTICKSEDWMQLLVSIDSENSEAWSMVASYRYRNLDIPGALSALERAAQAPRSHGYGIDLIRLMEQGLRASTNLGYRQRVVTAIGIASAQLHPFGPLTRGCQDMSETDERWLDACLSYAKRLENQGTIIMNTALGLRLQEKLLTIAGRTNELSAVKTRQDKLNSILERAGSDLVLYDDRFMSNFLDEWISHGELAAHEYVHQEFDKLNEEQKSELCR